MVEHHKLMLLLSNVIYSSKERLVACFDPMRLSAVFTLDRNFNRRGYS